MLVLSGTADMRVNTSNGSVQARPDLGFATLRSGTQEAVLHLTRGSAEILAGRTVQSAASAAIDFNASVGVSLEGREVLTTGPASGWEFNFIQYIKETLLRATYAAPDPDAGSIIMNMTETNLQYRLDSMTNVAPYPNRTIAMPDAGPGGATRMKNGFVDHPNHFQPLSWSNYATGKPNILVRLERQISFYTAFVAKKSGSMDYMPLSYVDWSAVWDHQILWKYRYLANGDLDLDPTKIERTSSFHVGNITNAYPLSDIAKLFETPTNIPDEMYSNIHANLVGQALATSDNANCHASRDWQRDVLPTFIAMP